MNFINFIIETESAFSENSILFSDATGKTKKFDEIFLRVEQLYK